MNIGGMLLFPLMITIQQSIQLIPNFVVQILLEDFIRAVKDKSIDLANFKKHFDHYKSLDKAFSTFLLWYFSIFQIQIIFNMFYMMSTFLVKTSVSTLDVVLLLGTILTLLGLAMSVIALSESFEASVDAIQDLKGRINESIRKASEREEIKDLEYCKAEAEMMKPMSAAGYFEIGNSTLTSMLSVRQVAM